MKIIKLPIEHKFKHIESIFSIDKNDKYIATSTINGEVKLWNIHYKLLKTFRKHEGSISTVRFSHDGNFIASAGDDARVVIIDLKTYEVVKVIKHMMNVTHIEWGDNFLVSTDLDGTIIITKQWTWTEKKQIQLNEKRILGLCISNDYKWMCIYTEEMLFIFKEFVEYKSRVFEKGLILEMMNLRLSFAPNNMYISVGLQFNNKIPTVDILDLELNRICSLIGHVAPCEITKFLPTAYIGKRIKNGEIEKVKYYIIAIASQDLSISFWNTLNPKPFLLIKNFSESPVLDMCWDGNSLIAVTYNGVVKKMEFALGELGEVIHSNFESDIIDIPFSPFNIELKKSYDASNHIIEPIENIKNVKLERINVKLNQIKKKTKLEENEINKKEKNEIIKELNKNDELNEVKNIINEEKEKENDKSGITSNDIEKLTIKTKINSQIGNKNKLIEKSELYSCDNKKIKIINENLKNKICEYDISNKIFVEIKNELKGMALFDTNLPDKLRIIHTEPFKHTVGQFTIELNTSATKLCIYRNHQYFYEITGNIIKVCFNSKYLVIYSKHIQIYRLETGCLIMPFISIRLAFLDLLDDRVLFVNTYGDFIVMDLIKNISWRDHLSKTKNLLQIELSREYFILAEYSEEILFYNPDYKFWFSLNPGFNTTATSKIDWENDKNETLTELEGKFCIFKMVKDNFNLKIVIRKIIVYFKNIQQLNFRNEYFLEEVLLSVEDKDEFRFLLKELNTILSFQEFVVKINKKKIKLEII